MMQIDSPTIDIAKRPKENRIKLLTKVYPSYAKDAEADCRRIIKHYQAVIDGQYWQEISETVEEYFLTYYGKPIEWFENLKRLVDETTTPTPTPTPTPKATAAEDHTQHLQLAIVSLTREIEQLENLGTRPGSLSASTTGGKYIQHQWVHSGKPKYVRKSEVATYQQEIERGREVQRLRDRLELLQSMVEGEANPKRSASNSVKPASKMTDETAEYVDRYVQNVQSESDEWHLKKGLRMLENHTLITYRDCKSFAAMVESYQRNGFYKRFADTWEDFCQKHIGESPEWIQHVKESINYLSPN